jgi:DNA-binding NtrC family response regulator
MPRVLLVDDEENQLRVLAMGLRLEGFDVATATNADQAIAELGKGHTDIVVLDLMMPGTNGIELARQLRERHPESRVVLTSAYHLSERQLERANCGVVGFVPKPYALNDLVEFLRRKLASGRNSIRFLAAQPAGKRADVTS